MESKWKQTKMGETLEDGLLHLYLHRTATDWRVTIYLRDGVTIGGVRGGDKIADESLGSNTAYEDPDGRHEDAEERASSWLLANANWLLSDEGAAAAQAWRASRGIH